MTTYVLPSSTTIGPSLLLVILILAPVSEVYKIMFVLPSIALDSSMACRVFRGLKLGLIEEIDECSVRSNSIRFVQDPAVTIGMISDIHEFSPPDAKAGLAVEVVDTSKVELSFHEHDNQGMVLSSWV